MSTPLPTAERICELLRFEGNGAVAYWVSGPNAGKKASQYAGGLYPRVAIDGHYFSTKRLIGALANYDESVAIAQQSAPKRA